MYKLPPVFYSYLLYQLYKVIRTYFFELLQAALLIEPWKLSFLATWPQL